VILLVYWEVSEGYGCLCDFYFFESEGIVGVDEKKEEEEC